MEGVGRACLYMCSSAIPTRWREGMGHCQIREVAEEWYRVIVSRYKRGESGISLPPGYIYSNGNEVSRK